MHLVYLLIFNLDIVKPPTPTEDRCCWLRSGYVIKNILCRGRRNRVFIVKTNLPYFGNLGQETITKYCLYENTILKTF